jgi:hypothetical protein
MTAAIKDGAKRDDFLLDRPTKRAWKKKTKRYHYRYASIPIAVSLQEALSPFAGKHRRGAGPTTQRDLVHHPRHPWLGSGASWASCRN